MGNRAAASRRPQKPRIFGAGRSSVLARDALTGVRLTMQEHEVSRLSRRAFLTATATLAVLTLSGASTFAQDAVGGQAEWRQSYESSERLTVPRETTPVMSAATLAA